MQCFGWIMIPLANFAHLRKKRSRGNK